MNRISVIVLITLCCLASAQGQHKLSDRDLLVLDAPADTMMRAYLTKIIDRQFSAREALLATLKSASDWNRRAQTIRDSIISWTGPFPERTPLNTRITGRLDREDYTIEKILFQSRPNLFVSANLYLPKKRSFPRPAVLNVIGHLEEGKAAELVQKTCIAQVRNGFVALSIDGLGQGERKIDGLRQSAAHGVIGNQAFLAGAHLFNFMVWDAIRAVDYLVGRTEVDPEKISITGYSGGGMMSTYILPFEPRISIAVPVCNPNTFSYRVHAGLATDAEQVFFGAFASGIDPRDDPLFTQAPKPLLINATTDDPLNPVRGVWDLSSWLFKAYSAHGRPENFATTMVKAGHDYNQEQRQITNAWLLRWSGGNAADFWEQPAKIEKEEDLWAAREGNVLNEPGSRHPRELIADHLEKHKAKWKPANTPAAMNRHREQIAALTGKALFTNLDKIAQKGGFHKNTRSPGNINIRQFVLEPESGIVLPGVFLERNTGNMNGNIVLYLHENGKSAILKDMDIANELLQKGYRICAVDLRGMGETAPGMATHFWDFLAGRPLFGQRTLDVLTVVKWLKGPSVKAEKIQLWGQGLCALYSAFAGTVTEDISGFILENPLISFENLALIREPKYRNEVLLPGILEKLDLPQVYQALSPRPLLILNPYAGDKTPAQQTGIDEISA
ncbi:MAG TPA: acetylxylan esterase, partial [Flavitalea sp.]|nr:acetylxylan esterase [Flavitalea sp.]